MDEQRQDDQLEPIYKSSVPIHREDPPREWTIEPGGERGLRKSILAARQDDDDDDKINLGKNKQQHLNPKNKD